MTAWKWVLPTRPVHDLNLIFRPDICTANLANRSIDSIYKGIQKLKYVQDLFIEDWRMSLRKVKENLNGRIYHVYVLKN